MIIDDDDDEAVVFAIHCVKRRRRTEQRSWKDTPDGRSRSCFELERHHSRSTTRLATSSSLFATLRLGSLLSAANARRWRFGAARLSTDTTAKSTSTGRCLSLSYG